MSLLQTQNPNSTLQHIMKSSLVLSTLPTPVKINPTTATTIRRLPPLFASAAAAPPIRYKTSVTHSLPPHKLDIFKSLESWVAESVLPLLRPVDRCWQPSDFLPVSSQPYDQFSAEVKALRDRTANLPDDLLVILVGGMVTEEALPTYQTVFNTFDGVKDETGSDSNAWATWTRAWTAEENRHGDLLSAYLYLSGRVDTNMIAKTTQYLIGSGMDAGTENNPYLGFVYTSFQERATFISHGNTARLAKEGGDPILARICGTIASDEKRHENAYVKIVEKLLQVDPTGVLLGVATMMKKKITMPGHFMFDGQDPSLFEHYSAVAQQLGIYTTNDYVDILEYLIGRWRLEKIEDLTDEGRRAQEFVCGLAPKIRKLQERADEKAKKMEPRDVKFSWIFNKEVTV